ncbi:MAG: GNAT family N-acetyltransferase [Nocardioides sp.]
MPLLVRRATTADYDTAGEVTVAAYADFTRGPDDPYVERLRDAASRDREAELWVAEDQGRLLGCVTVCPPGSPWRELSGDHEGEFRMLAVHPDARGRGVGEALARLCLERFRAEGAEAVVLSSLRQMAAAHRLYGRLGFERLPERDWEPVPGVELIAFRLSLHDDQEEPR